jgi:hypothetical protein
MLIRIIFLGPQGGIVRVVFVEGKIEDVDSTLSKRN